ncbi:MAG: hypothetical protein FJ245_13980 [Nitrospira sp.]|nr:hypothetical protein [Nitrospira sp.]
MQIAENVQPLQSAIFRWAASLKSWNLAWETGIYPGEMAAFLGVCEMAGVRTIIESGRGDHAYSTRVLGEYSERTGVAVYSIDLVPNAKQIADLEDRYPQLRCLVGSAFDFVPVVAARQSGPLALLLDGPKMRPANRLSMMVSAVFNVVVVAHHNCPLESPWGKEFAEVFPGAFHYEDLMLAQAEEWRAFKTWERDCVKSYEISDEDDGTVGRSLEMSSLAVARLERCRYTKKRLFSLWQGDPRHNPLMLYAKWRLQNGSLSKCIGQQTASSS